MYLKRVVIISALAFPVGETVSQSPPPLAVQEWLNSKPTTSDHRPYVVEFASTSCPPCRKSLPQLAALTHKYNGQISFITIFSNDSNSSTNYQYVTRIRNLFESTQPQMPFHVGIDSAGRTSMNRYNVTSWPTILVIDPNAGILWRGHSTSELDAVVNQIINKTFNPLEIKQTQKTFMQRINRVSQLQYTGNQQAALQAADSLLKEFPEQQSVLIPIKFKLLIGHDDRQAYQLLREALRTRSDIVWEKMIDPAWTATLNPDCAVVMLLFDRVLEEAPTDRVKVALMLRKAHVLRHRALNTPDSSALLFNKARQVLQEVMQYALEAEERAQWSQKYLEYDYLCTVAEGDSNLNQLNSIRDADKKGTAWMSVTDAVLKLNNKAACTHLIPWVSVIWTEALQKKDDRLVIWSGERLVKLYKSIGDQLSGLKTCQESINYFQHAGNETKTDSFEKLLESLN